MLIVYFRKKKCLISNTYYAENNTHNIIFTLTTITIQPFSEYHDYQIFSKYHLRLSNCGLTLKFYFSFLFFLYLYIYIFFVIIL